MLRRAAPFTWPPCAPRACTRQSPRRGLGGRRDVRAMMQGLLRLADLLFGTTLPPRSFGRPALVRYAAVTAASVLIIVARRPDAVLRAQFRGEAGRAFFAEQLTLGFWGALTHLHYGLLYLPARI